MKKKIFVAGGDMRQLYAAEKLSENFSVYLTGFDNNIMIPEQVSSSDILSFPPCSADYVLLPMPATSDGVMLSAPFCRKSIPVAELISVIKENGIVFAGKTDEKTKRLFCDSGIELIDYLDREEFSILNAVPTAEGTVQIALEEMNSTVHGSRILIAGYGRIARILADILKSMGADVTAAARKYSDLAWAEVNRCKSVNICELEKRISEYDLIINTVPSMIFSKSVLNKINRSALIIDLASVPGGVDMDAASDLGIKAIKAPGLPGKSAPVTAGRIIADTVINILTERGLIYEQTGRT